MTAAISHVHFTTYLDDTPVHVLATVGATRGEPGSLSITDTLYISSLTVHAYDPRTHCINLDPIPRDQFTADQFEALYMEAERLAGIRD